MNRYTPFGYKVENGSTVVNAIEADAVKRAFEMYIDGASYKTIAEYMESAGVNYRQDSAKWNKNLVKRILENRRYIGTDGFFAIISNEDFDRAAEIISAKGACQGVPHPLDAIKGKAVCSECGKPFRRIHDKRRKLTWYCSNRSCKSSPLLSDDTMETAVTEIINRIINNPFLLRPAKIQPAPNLEVTRLNNEINRQLSETEINRDYITALLLKSAAAEYNSCDDGESDRQTGRLREIFSKEKPIDEFNGGLFEKTVRRLYIAQDGEVTLELTNHQLIGREKS